MGNSNKYKKTTTIGEIERLKPFSVPWYKKRLIVEHQQRYKFALQYVKGKTVLDIACGSGFGSALIATIAKKVYAIDNDNDAITYAKQYYQKRNIVFTQGDAQKMNIEEKSIDVVVSFETIEHLKNPKKFLQEIKRVLTDKGIVILSTPNKNFSHGDNPYHLKEFSFIELNSLLSTFRIVSFYGQRPVSIQLFALYKKLEQYFPFAKKVFRIRPWERLIIKQITKQTNYLYFLAICKKER